jgi:hypothetical protein
LGELHSKGTANVKNIQDDSTYDCKITSYMFPVCLSLGTTMSSFGIGKGTCNTAVEFETQKIIISKFEWFSSDTITGIDVFLLPAKA